VVKKMKHLQIVGSPIFLMTVSVSHCETGLDEEEPKIEDNIRSLVCLV